MNYASLPLLAVLVAATLAPVEAEATNGYFTHGFGVRAQGVAGVGYALPQDSLAAATNPAGTGLVGDRLDLGMTWFKPNRGADITGNLAGADGHYDGSDDASFLIPEFGFTQTISERASWGLAVYGNGGMNTSYRENPFAAFGSTGRAGVDLSQLFITPSLAFKVTAEHTIGLAATYAHQRFEASGLSAFDNPAFSNRPGSLTDRGHDTADGWGVKLGWTGKLHERFTVGAAWSSRIATDEFNRYSGLFADNGGFDIPETWGVGIAWQALPALTVAADWQHIDYGTTRSVGNTLSLLFEGNLFGAASGPGFGWQDVEVAKLGVVYTVAPSVILRAGISHTDQPIPEGETFINILAPGVVEDHASIGATWQSETFGEWSFAYTRVLEETIRGNNSIPLAFGGGEADLRMDQHILGIAWTKEF
ncbi:OmpP1/FadL family transporter [Kineobactrum sediminis]|uniref:OmpP1/FadL family transporter n=1 Tax=Kineobactrum sediminis TaxID=1905677 RepID=UPI001F4E409C|nr:outer membrane protein transport protein [Kineobactrum sediminis]